MSLSEYILALMSIVVGLAMTQLLSGAAEIVRQTKRCGLTGFIPPGW